MALYAPNPGHPLRHTELQRYTSERKAHMASNTALTGVNDLGGARQLIAHRSPKGMSSTNHLQPHQLTPTTACKRWAPTHQE